mgnify:CR=1 FL=1
MRELPAWQITEAIQQLCVDANRVLPSDLEALVKQRSMEEPDQMAQSILCDLCRNLDAAREMGIPICQDTGMAVVFAEVGQELHIQGDFEAAVNEGVRRGYVEGLLRCSVVKDPIRRGNTEDNTPAILHTRLVPGDKLTLTVAPKGFGSENMSRLKMFTPAAKEEDIIGFVREKPLPSGGAGGRHRRRLRAGGVSGKESPVPKRFPTESGSLLRRLGTAHADGGQ